MAKKKKNPEPEKQWKVKQFQKAWKNNQELEIQKNKCKERNRVIKKEKNKSQENKDENISKEKISFVVPCTLFMS